MDSQRISLETANTNAISDPLDVRYPRDWELCFRSAEILLHCILDRPGVPELRKKHFGYAIFSHSTAEAERFSPAVAEQADWLANRWVSLFDDWARDPTGYVFPDGYALLFFLCVLHGNMNVVLRGQVNADWQVTTSLSRLRESQGAESAARAREAAGRFIARISAWEPLKAQYPTGLREEHQEAISQHYGFPTEYIDVTLAYDVALFFAEDWKEIRDSPMPQRGAIYALPINVASRHSSLVTLPPVVMRPNLQFGKFLRGDSSSTSSAITTLAGQ